MKYIFPLFIIFLFSFTSRTKQFIPPGTVKYNDTLFIDQTEISNWSWREYEAWMRTKYGKNSSQHMAVLPDTLVWRDNASYNEPYVEHYYRHNAYKNYPVVGVSYEQVLGFCKWRTEMVMIHLAKQGKYKLLDFEYRLPTRKEWETLSYNGKEEFYNNGYTDDKQAKMNLVHDDTLGTASVRSDKADVTAPVYSYWKNTFGIYNMIGNVAEMVSEKGICKGGSWRHSLEECRVGKDISYENPTAWLGFRCVCVVKKSQVEK